STVVYFIGPPNSSYWSERTIHMLISAAVAANRRRGRDTCSFPRQKSGVGFSFAASGMCVMRNTRLRLESSARYRYFLRVRDFLQCPQELVVLRSRTLCNPGRLVSYYRVADVFS